MATFRRFEDIEAWQRSRTLVSSIYEVSGHGEWETDYALKNQIRRASISAMSNIAEGFGRRSDKEFANFLNMTHGSVAEVQSQLYVALDQSYILQRQFQECYDLAGEVSKMVMGLSSHLRRS